MCCRTMPDQEFKIREATFADVPALAHLHVVTFRETHGGPGPTDELRYGQWREVFATQDESSFCFVISNAVNELVGFTKGVPYTGDLPGFSGELNKIYLLREYQRRGLGRRLMGHVANRFLSQNVDSMLLFGDAYSPSNAFYETMGGEKLFSAAGEFHGGYGWRDLHRLVEI